MSILTWFMEKIAALLVAGGCPVDQSTLFALILIYLLVSGFIAGLLILLVLRRRNREGKQIASPPDRES